MFDTIVSGIQANDLIKSGAISPYNYYARDLGIDLTNVNKLAGDYNNEQLGKAMSTKKIYGDILKYYKMLADNKQGIAYCVNVAHSKEVCQMFNSNNISSIHIDSHTSEEEREIVLEKFKKGEFKILCNCNLISERYYFTFSRCVFIIKTYFKFTSFYSANLSCAYTKQNCNYNRLCKQCSKTWYAYSC